MAAVRCNFGDVLQAIRDKLVTDAVVKDRGQVIWTANDDVANLISTWDILLKAATGINEDLDGGSYDFRMVRLIDVRVRTQSIKGPGQTNEDWVTKQFILHDQVLASIGHGQFTPQKSGKDLTVCAIKTRSDLAPNRSQDASTWGDSVCILEARYLPLVTPIPPD